MPSGRPGKWSTSVRPTSRSCSRPGSRSAGRQVRLRNAENRYRGDWEELVSLVGAPELRPTPLDPRPLEAEVVPLNFDGTLADLLHRSPEIQAALSEIRRDQIMVRRERVEPIPEYPVQAVTGYNYEFGVQTAGVQIGITLPIFNRNQGTIREAMSDLSRDHAEYRTSRLVAAAAAGRGVHPLSGRLAVGRGFPRPAACPWRGGPTRCRSTSYRQRRTTWPAGARGPAHVLRPQQGLRRIAAGAAAGRKSRSAACSWSTACSSHPSDLAGPHRVGADAPMIDEVGSASRSTIGRLTTESRTPAQFPHDQLARQTAV